MSDSTTHAEVRAQAIRRLRRKRELRMHIVAFLVVLGALWVVWAVMAVQLDVWFPWPVFPTVGWGIGLALHAWSVYGPPPRPMTEESALIGCTWPQLAKQQAWFLRST